MALNRRLTALGIIPKETTGIVYKAADGCRCLLPILPHIIPPNYSRWDGEGDGDGDGDGSGGGGVGGGGSGRGVARPNAVGADKEGTCCSIDNVERNYLGKMALCSAFCRLGPLMAGG
ncbi:hypothetical protein V1478_002508 [Vespula squamosa]|uniref:Uncharacterized protein n=1 Tax=Vespula squamosa TaxID=30214 RepID=A0ABD2BT86_VESSQ